MSVLDHSKTTAKRDELILRIVSALVLAPLTIGVTLLGGNVFDGFWFIAAVLMSYEFLRLITPFYRPFWGAVFIHVSIFFALYGFLSETNPGIVLKLIAPSLFLLFVLGNRLVTRKRVLGFNRAGFGRRLRRHDGRGWFSASRKVAPTAH
jgi:hypothetical protein